MCTDPAYLSEHGGPKISRDLTENQLIRFNYQPPDRWSTLRVFDPRRTKYRLFIDDGSDQEIAIVAGAGILITSL